MEVEHHRESLIKLSIPKLKVLCGSFGLKFKSKWRKREYIEELEKKIAEKKKNEEVSNENDLSLGLAAAVEENRAGGGDSCPAGRLQNSFLPTTSTPIPNKNKKKRGVLFLSLSTHKFFQTLRGQDAPQPDEVTNWKKNPLPSTIPKISVVDIYDYLVQRKTLVDNVSTKQFKGFNKSVAHLEAKDIINGIETSLVSDQFLYVKSSCYPSMKPESYRVVVVLDSLDGNICGGACECIVGKSGTCSHVGALLLLLEKYAGILDEDFEVSCTSLPCSWNAPKLRKVHCKPLSEISWNKPNLYCGKKQLSLDNKNLDYSKFDPRHPADRSPNKKRIKKAIIDLREIYPKTGAQQFWDLDNDHEISSISISDPAVFLTVQYDTPLTAKDVSIDNETDILRTKAIKLVYKPSLTYEEVDEALREEFVRNQFTTQDVIDYIEKGTINQSESDLWKTIKVGRPSSSMFGVIFGCREKKFPTSIVDNILNPTKLDSYKRLPPAILRGRNLEPLARQLYEELFKVKVEPSGFSLMKEYSFIGASGDGLISDPTETTQGVLEIKCPCSIKGTDISKMKIEDIVENYPSFCLKKLDGNIQLDRKSHYYSQVQGEMGVKNLKWADFVIFTEAKEGGIFRERIMFDQQYWGERLLPKLVHFFKTYIVPFLVNNSSSQKS